MIIKYYVLSTKYVSISYPSLIIAHTPHSSYFQDSDGPPRPEGVHPPVFSALRQSRVVSSTSEEEEALTEKFLKINCKYITDGKVRYRIKDTHIYEYGHLFMTLLVMSQTTANCCSQKHKLSAAKNLNKCGRWNERRSGWVGNQTNYINIQQSCQLQVLNTLHVSKGLAVNVASLEKLEERYRIWNETPGSKAVQFFHNYSVFVGLL